MKNKKPLLKSITLGVSILLGFLIYAYAFQVTKVDFETAQDSRRLTQLTRVLRALVHPNIFEYDKEEQLVDYPLYLPCPEEGLPTYEPDTSGPYLVLEPACGDPKEYVQISGYNFPPNTAGPINFIGQSGVILQLGNLAADADGYFTAKIQLPDRQPVAEAQTIQAVARVNVGSPHFTEVAKTTWDAILETVFLALLATTFGTLLAIPISFFAARNLMSDVKSSLTSASLSIIAWPIGIALGGLAAVWISSLISGLEIYISGGGIILSALITWFTARLALPPEEAKPPSKAVRIARNIVLVISFLNGIACLNYIAVFFQSLGDLIMENLSWVSFIGYFTYQFGDIVKLLSPVLVALALGGALGGIVGKAGQSFSDRMTDRAIKTLNVIVSAIAGAILFALIGQVINWFYQIEEIGNFSDILNLTKTLWIPAGIGALAGIVLALFFPAKKTVPTGMVIYAITRTILNGLRSIEPLVMAIVFVIWVGIGPFAGALALGLHTIAALGKLYSEQVESISAGPIEAVTATGANRLQTIIYAVVPQIIPPYISFTMYRWDINVRMSTIIGFVGGGGIGFLLQQNIRLLHYRDASAQMFAIAIVVASMDYISSSLRERFV